jgi:hypothetical protein
MSDRLERRLASKVKQGFRGHPLATIAFYGPDRDTATKVAVSIFTRDDADPDQLKRWHSSEGDLRNDDAIGQEVMDFLQTSGVRSVVLSDGVMGCPHEEGTDYPEGQSCPRCPYWAGRDRWTDERIQ